MGWDPSLKSVSMLVLIVMVSIATYLGWRWLDDVLTTVETQTTAINNLNKTIGSKDQQISTLDTARLAAERKLNSMRPEPRYLTKRVKRMQNKLKNISKSNVLQQKTSGAPW